MMALGGVSSNVLPTAQVFLHSYGVVYAFARSSHAETHPLDSHSSIQAVFPSPCSEKLLEEASITSIPIDQVHLQYPMSMHSASPFVL
jgi:hypothetical protein